VCVCVLLEMYYLYFRQVAISAAAVVVNDATSRAEIITLSVALIQSILRHILALPHTGAGLPALSVVRHDCNMQ
jgi:hypothetical protein